MQWVVQEVKQTDAEKGPPEFLDYPHPQHSRCIVCYRPGTINCLDCHGDVYCETMSQFNTDGDPVSCWSTFHGKEGTGRANHVQIQMKQEQQWLGDFLAQRKWEKKEQANKAKLLKYSHQKKKMNQRRKSGFKLNPQSGGTTGGTESEVFENTEVSEIGLCCTCWWYSLCNFQYRPHYEHTGSYNFEC
jgi:hypothetical protein